VFTGEVSANGAIAKLFVNNPFMQPRDMLDRYVSLVRYIVPRLIDWHFADAKPWGYLVPALAFVPLLAKRTRPMAVFLWAQIVGWLALVALNNQLRWHNERYAMPAVAWLVVLDAMALGVIAGGAVGARRLFSRRIRAWLQPARMAVALVLATTYWHHQEPHMRDQIWFFGRASRNILDQHVAAGRFLKKLKAKRVLVGDAGALTYASDRPGLDIIGLGGYGDLPFARATVHGLGAAIELIEHIPSADRPDIMAIYPSWWGELPVYFGSYITAFPVTGNVICGGAEKVIFEARWGALDGGGRPRTLLKGELVADELDQADLLSEQAHRYRFEGRGIGFVAWRVLDDPRERAADLFDAGRIVPPGATERATMFAPGSPARLIVRFAPTRPTRVAVTVDGKSIGEIKVEPGATQWLEQGLPLPDELRGRFELGLNAVDAESISYHVWVVGRPSARE
jgi:hypothetical protein